MENVFQVPLLPRCSWRLWPAWQDFPCDRNSNGWDLARSLTSSKLQTTQNVLLQTPNSTRGAGRQKPSSLSPRVAQVWSLIQLLLVFQVHKIFLSLNQAKIFSNNKGKQEELHIWPGLFVPGCLMLRSARPLRLAYSNSKATKGWARMKR